MSIVPVLYKERNFNVTPPAIQAGGVKAEFLLELDKNSELAKQNQNARNKQAMDTYSDMMKEKRKHAREIAETVTEQYAKSSESIKGITAHSSQLKAMWEAQLGTLHAEIASGSSAVAATSKFRSALGEDMARAIAEEEVVTKTIEVMDEFNGDANAMGFFDIGGYSADIMEGRINPMNMNSTDLRDNYLQADYEKIAYKVNEDCMGGGLSGSYSEENQKGSQGAYSTKVETSRVEKDLHDRCRAQYINQVKVSVRREFNERYELQGGVIGDENYQEALANHIEMHADLWYGDPATLVKRDLDVKNTVEYNPYGYKGSKSGSGPKKKTKALTSMTFVDKERDESFESGWLSKYKSLTGDSVTNYKDVFVLKDQATNVPAFLKYVAGADIANLDGFKAATQAWKDADDWVSHSAPKEHFSTDDLIDDGVNLDSSVMVATKAANEGRPYDKIDFPITDKKVAEEMMNLYNNLQMIRDDDSLDTDQKKYDALQGMYWSEKTQDEGSIPLQVLVKSMDDVLESLGIIISEGQWTDGNGEPGNPFYTDIDETKRRQYHKTDVNDSDNAGVWDQEAQDQMLRLGMFVSAARRKPAVVGEVTGEASKTMPMVSDIGKMMDDIYYFYPQFEAPREYNDTLLSTVGQGNEARRAKYEKSTAKPK